MDKFLNCLELTVKFSCLLNYLLLFPFSSIIFNNRIFVYVFIPENERLFLNQKILPLAA